MFFFYLPSTARGSNHPTANPNHQPSASQDLKPRAAMLEKQKSSNDKRKVIAERLGLRTNFPASSNLLRAARSSQLYCVVKRAGGTGVGLLIHKG